ncbi:unnamed protein product [Sphenostylis stenocarpa]|uniref:Uncharacterized protein n=1 Tax=Sphenostylis stenocarpa TaxID=92480 RepID=A0AA86S5K3_9FABA|nr:unnamed protein product [Sphenostylis stenocarpa]
MQRNECNVIHLIPTDATNFPSPSNGSDLSHVSQKQLSASLVLCTGKPAAFPKWWFDLLLLTQHKMNMVGLVNRSMFQASHLNASFGSGGRKLRHRLNKRMTVIPIGTVYSSLQ